MFLETYHTNCYCLLICIFIYVILSNPHLRTYDKEKGIYYTYNRFLKQIEYDFWRLRDELNDMLQKIYNNPMSSVAWVDTMPTENVE